MCTRCTPPPPPRLAKSDAATSPTATRAITTPPPPSPHICGVAGVGALHKLLIPMFKVWPTIAVRGRPAHTLVTHASCATAGHGAQIHLSKLSPVEPQHSSSLPPSPLPLPEYVYYENRRIIVRYFCLVRLTFSCIGSQGKRTYWPHNTKPTALHIHTGIYRALQNEPPPSNTSFARSK